MIIPVLLARRWTVTGSADGLGDGLDGACPAQADLFPGQRIGSDAQQLAGIGVEEHQGVLPDADGNLAGRRGPSAMT